MPPSKTVIAFDLYGTLLSTESVAKELAKIYGDDKAQSLATQWRWYQLEYTWRINSMGQIWLMIVGIARGLVHLTVTQACTAHSARSPGAPWNTP